jgi:hypothetical protein
MCRLVEAHIAMMSAARSRGDLRTVLGHSYPVPEGEFRMWQDAQAAIRRAKVKAFLKSRTAIRAQAEAAFA